MQEDNNVTHLTNDEWSQLDFDGKEQFHLNEQQEIVLKQTNKEDKILGHLDATAFETERNRLTSNFNNLSEQFAKAQSEWEKAEDKLKARGFVKNLDKAIVQTDFLGDATAMNSFIAEKKTAINDLFETNATTQLKLVEEAEAIKESDDWHNTTERYKAIVDEWKDGPEIKRSVNEEYWKRINEAKDHFFEKKRAHYENVEKEQMVNLDLKIELCEKAEALQDSEDWKSTSEAMYQMMEDWKKIGHLPSQEKNDEMWERFSVARTKFFDKKEAHTKNIKQEQEENYQKKLALVEEVEALQHSTQWKETTDKMNELQEAWKQVGRAPREFNDALWDRWRAARDFFFDNKREQAKAYRQNLEENYERKKVITERAEHLVNSIQWKNTTQELTELMTEWKTIGPVPREYGDDLWNRFNVARRAFFKRKDEDRDKRRAFYEQKESEKLHQKLNFLNTLKAEQQDEENKIAEFKESLNNIDGDGKKDEELKEHLTSLIQKIENGLPKRAEKIAAVEDELAKLQEKE